MKSNEIILFHKRLEETLPKGEWKTILETLDVTGCADNNQLQQATGLGKDKLRRTLEKMGTARAGFPPLFRLSNKKLARPGLKGRAPKVYLFGESGAALRRHFGNKDSRASNLSNPIAQAHALAVLDVYLTGIQAQLPVKTEKRVYASKKNYLRPDTLITLPSGEQAIFEVEQLARPNYTPRMARSLRQKADFFQQNTDTLISPTIRVLFNLNPGKNYNKSLERWRSLYTLSAEERGGTLPFSLFAMPLMDFLSEPDWDDPATSRRWVELSKGTRLEPPEEDKPDSLAPLPPPLLHFTSKQNVLVLKALWQEFNGQDAKADEAFVSPDPQFFELVQVIYLASHNPNGTALERAAFPNASLYLLREYLRMHPELTAKVERTMNKGWSMHWNATTILHRMQSVVDVFLAFHGFSTDGALKVFSQVVDWNADQPKSFVVRVKITTPKLLTDDLANFIPRREDVVQVEKALAWILRALFVHAERLGLRPPKFW